MGADLIPFLHVAQSELRDARDETRKLRDEFKAFKGALSASACLLAHAFCC